MLAIDLRMSQLGWCKVESRNSVIFLNTLEELDFSLLQDQIISEPLNISQWLWLLRTVELSAITSVQCWASPASGNGGLQPPPPRSVCPFASAQAEWQLHILVAQGSVASLIWDLGSEVITLCAPKSAPLIIKQDYRLYLHPHNK